MFVVRPFSVLSKDEIVRVGSLPLFQTKVVDSLTQFCFGGLALVSVSLSVWVYGSSDAGSVPPLLDLAPEARAKRADAPFFLSFSFLFFPLSLSHTLSHGYSNLPGLSTILFEIITFLI